MRFDATHKGYGIRIRKSDRLYALIFRPGYTRPMKDIPAAETDEGEALLLERAQQIIERDLKPHES
jgi:hypothetical protein